MCDHCDHCVTTVHTWPYTWLYTSLVTSLFTHHDSHMAILVSHTTIHVSRFDFVFPSLSFPPLFLFPLSSTLLSELLYVRHAEESEYEPSIWPSFFLFHHLSPPFPSQLLPMRRANEPDDESPRPHHRRRGPLIPLTLFTNCVTVTYYRPISKSESTRKWDVFTKWNAFTKWNVFTKWIVFTK